DLVASKKAAKQLLWDAHRLWNHIESQVVVREDEIRRSLGGTHDRWAAIFEVWKAMGILVPSPEGNSFLLSFRTRMDDPCYAKCPSCGAVGKATKSRLLDPITCPKCRV